jgi:hypothetical protein
VEQGKLDPPLAIHGQTLQQSVKLHQKGNKEGFPNRNILKHDLQALLETLLCVWLPHMSTEPQPESRKKSAEVGAMCPASHIPGELALTRTTCLNVCVYELDERKQML